MSDNQISSNSVLLRDYAQKIKSTDIISPSNLQPILFGLFGEVGSIMAAAKKKRREESAHPDSEYQQTLEEEFGDVLWYLATLCRRLNFDIAEIFSEAASQNKYTENIAASDHPSGPISRILSTGTLPYQDQNASLLELGKTASTLFDGDSSNEHTRNLLCTFSHNYLQALQENDVVFSTVVASNIAKVHGRFVKSNLSDLPKFDESFPEDEQIPQNFTIRIMQRKSGKSYLQWGKVFIGDPLTDNSLDPDGYRFHDVFHLANAAILHWSPVFRGLIKQKRKSDPSVDEIQDGGRASVIEEGLSAWIFSRAKQLNYFEGHSSISFDILKTVQQFVRGYEVEKCPLKLWENAILEGYKVFRQVLNNNGGIIIGDRKSRTIKYKSIK